MLPRLRCSQKNAADSETQLRTGVFFDRSGIEIFCCV
jgi:hypothetical protein